MSTNRKILVDNATLSGVERIIGTSQTLNLNNTDNDILCLEKLVSAILFSDEVVGVDDYKDAYRSDRLKNFDFVKFVKLEPDVYATLASDAAAFARSMAFSFDGSKPAGDVVQFFEALRIDPQLRWDVWVSSEYLTLSFLVDDPKAAFYEQAIDSAFRSEGVDQTLVSTEADHRPAFSVSRHPGIKDVKEFVQALGQQNPQYSGTDGRSALDRLVFGYGWVAERSHFYNAVARAENADVYLAPLRDAFCESCCRIEYPQQVSALLDRLKDKSQDTLAAIFEPGGQAKFALRLPFFTAYLISKTDTPKQCVDLALSLRDNRDFKECRAIFHNLDHLSAADRLQEMNRILRYLDESCANLMRKYAVSTGNGTPFSLSFGLSGIGLEGPLKLDQLFRWHKNRPFTRVFRNIAQDMLNVERLGGLYDKVRASVRQHKDATYPKISATPRFMERKESERGRPAKL